MVAAGSITVAVRVRPPNAWEASRIPGPCNDAGLRGDGALSAPSRAVVSCGGLREVVKIIDDRVLVFDPDEKDRARAFVERGFVPPGTKRYKDKRFMFDRVFDDGARQIDVYEATSKPLLDRLLDGYNATVFAYGATGCGKTHTISGADADPGIIYLTMADLFAKIEDRKANYNVDIYVTFLEIYNEEIRDLLAETDSPTPRGGLQIREDRTVKVVGLTELHPENAEQIKEIVLLGNTRRTQSPTHANETSSRSHAVLQVHVAQSPRTASTTEERTMATLSIIDLAGSERAAATSNMGQRMVEGANINKSLLALGNCINALCESGGGTRHVPYRNSKLTRLLKFSLGGNCKTVMIVCIAPTSNHFDDTHNTLLYADRASKIKTKVVTRNVVNVDRHVGQYVEAINRLNLEVAELKARLSGKLQAEADVARRKREVANAEVERAKMDMHRKAEQMLPAIIDAAACEVTFDVARAKLQAYDARLKQIGKLKTSGSLSPDIAVESSYLSWLASPEKELLQPGSALQIRWQRSSNSDSMFDATLRALSERRSDHIDEAGVDAIKTDSQHRKEAMERLKAEAQRDILRQNVAVQSAFTVCLLGLLSRCTTALENGHESLQRCLNDSPEQLIEYLQNISTSLHSAAHTSSTSLQQMLNEPLKFTASEESSIPSFADNSLAVLHSPMAVSMNPPLKLDSTRRFSSAVSAVTSPARRIYRASPRKSLRTSLVHSSSRSTSRRPSSEKKKVVQWKDEAGQGELDDRLANLTIEEVLPRRPLSVCGSESEWEDESVASTSFMLPTRDMPPLSGTRRCNRASRLDLSFLRSRTSTLGSLAEDDESNQSMKLPAVDRRSSPFVDRANQLPTPPDSTASSQKAAPHEASPAKRMSAILRVHGSASRKERRRSNMGPQRHEKARRRSSLLPVPSPLGGENATKGGARRVPIAQTPSKRAKRVSLLGCMRPASTRTSLLRALPSGVTLASDTSGSGDVSFRNTKPTWR